jgi:hypothetical protein
MSMLSMYGKIGLAAVLAFGALTFKSGEVSATPLVDNGVAIAAGASSNIDQAHWRHYRHWHHHHWRHHYRHHWHHHHHHHY